MIAWIEEFERKLNAKTVPNYKRLKALKEERFQGNLRINFSDGEVVSANLYETMKL